MFADFSVARQSEHSVGVVWRPQPTGVVPRRQVPQRNTCLFVCLIWLLVSCVCLSCVSCLTTPSLLVALLFCWPVCYAKWSLGIITTISLKHLSHNFVYFCNYCFHQYSSNIKSCLIPRMEMFLYFMLIQNVNKFFLKM